MSVPVEELSAVAEGKFDVLKTNIRPKSEASRANLLLLRTALFYFKILSCKNAARAADQI